MVITQFEDSIVIKLVTQQDCDPLVVKVVKDTVSFPYSGTHKTLHSEWAIALCGGVQLGALPPLEAAVTLQTPSQNSG